MFCVMLDYYGKSNQIEISMKTSGTVEYLDVFNNLGIPFVIV